MGRDNAKIVKGLARKKHPSKRSGYHKNLKRMMNRWIRRNKMNMPEKGRIRQYNGLAF